MKMCFVPISKLQIIQKSGLKRSLILHELELFHISINNNIGLKKFRDQQADEN